MSLRDVDHEAGLPAFASHWRFDGVWIVCKRCSNAQHVQKANEAFHHRSDCAASVTLQPWLLLRAVINEAITP